MKTKTATRAGARARSTTKSGSPARSRSAPAKVARNKAARRTRVAVRPAKRAKTAPRKVKVASRKVTAVPSRDKAAPRKVKAAATTAKIAPPKVTTAPRKPKAVVERSSAVARRKAPPSAAPALRWTETLSDGSHVIIRPIRKEDAALERAFIARLSPQSRRMRFLGTIKEPSEELIRSLTDIDYRRDMAFIALVHRDNQTLEIGVSRFSTSDDGSTCECAVTVSDEWHHRGLATLLMRHLIEVARARGIRSMVSYDSPENVEMRELATFLGFEHFSDTEDRSMVIHRLKL
jgi:GNAT superfamily N-acetyltransferase